MAPMSSLFSSESEGTRVLTGSNTAPGVEHEVFLSIVSHGTHANIAGHLYAAFTRHGIRTYTDYNLIKGGEEISVTHPRAIEDAQLSVIVFTKKYADSRWCLDDVEKILELSKTKKHIIVPVFYDVDPSTVRKQMGSYAEAFAKYEQEFKDDLEKVRSWRKALTEAASFSGWDFTNTVRTEHELVEEIAKDVVEKLDRVYVGEMDFQIGKLEKLAQLQQEISQEIHNSENERNYKSTLERIIRLKMEKKFRLLRLTPDLLSHLEISKTTDTYF